MPDTAARRIEDMTASERAALVAKQRADRAGTAHDNNGSSPMSGYGIHAGREGAPAFDHAQPRFREH